MATFFDDPQGQDYSQDNYAPSDYGGSPYKSGIMDLPAPANSRFTPGNFDFGQTFRGSPVVDNGAGGSVGTFTGFHPVMHDDTTAQNQTFNNPSGYYPANPQPTLFDQMQQQGKPQFQAALENPNVQHPGWNFGEAGPPGSPDYVRHPQNQQDWQARFDYFRQNPEQAMPDWKPVNQFYQQNDPNAVNYLRQLMAGQQQYRYMTPQGAAQQLQAWGYLPPPAPVRPAYSGGGGGYAPRPSYSSYAPRPATNYTAPSGNILGVQLPQPARVQAGANAIAQAANAIKPGIMADIAAAARNRNMSQVGQGYYTPAPISPYLSMPVFSSPPSVDEYGYQG